MYAVTVTVLFRLNSGSQYRVMKMKKKKKTHNTEYISNHKSTIHMQHMQLLACDDRKFPRDFEWMKIEHPLKIAVFYVVFRKRDFR